MVFFKDKYISSLHPPHQTLTAYSTPDKVEPDFLINMTEKDINETTCICHRSLPLALWNDLEKFRGIQSPPLLAKGYEVIKLNDYNIFNSHIVLIQKACTDVFDSR